MNKKVQVNREQCQKVGKILGGFTIKPSVYKREFLRFHANPEIKLIAYLFSIAICHQTHRLMHRKLNLAGFEYLEKVFIDLAKSQSELLDPSYVAKETCETLAFKLGAACSETDLPEHSTLDNLQERAELLIDMSGKLMENYEGSISKLLAVSQGYLSGEQGLYALLSPFKAYSDPLKKKSSLFVMFAESANLLKIADLECYVPIMDYHIQRVLLRLGCVEILDPNLRSALINQEKLESDEEIRTASIAATQKLALYSGHPVTKIHDFLWPLGRSCCKEKPLCKSGTCDKTPCTFDKFVNLSSHRHCIFQGTCKGSLDENYIRLWQPIVETHYY